MILKLTKERNWIQPLQARSSYIARLWWIFFNDNPQDQDILYFGQRMKDDHCNIKWFVSYSAPKTVDVFHQFEGTLIKISETCYQFYPIF